MAYETGTALDATDLLDKMRGFLLNNGWNQNLWGNIDSIQRLHMNKGDMYINFRSSNNGEQFWSHHICNENYKGIAFYLSTGFNSNLLWHEQPGGIDVQSYYSLFSNVNSVTGIVGSLAPVYSYYFFKNNKEEYLFIAETDPNVFRSMYFGKNSVLKDGEDTLWLESGTGVLGGGVNINNTLFSADFYIRTINPRSASSHTNIRYNGEWFSNLGHNNHFSDIKKIICPMPASSSTSVHLNSGGFLSSFCDIPFDQSPFILYPLMFGIEESPYYYPITTIELVKSINYGSYTPAQEITLAGNTWMVFPNNSSPLGLAVKKTV